MPQTKVDSLDFWPADSCSCGVLGATLERTRYELLEGDTEEDVVEVVMVVADAEIEAETEVGADADAVRTLPTDDMVATATMTEDCRARTIAHLVSYREAWSEIWEVLTQGIEAVVGGHPEL